MSREGVLVNEYPKDEKPARDLKAFEIVMQNLLLEECSFERNPATGEIGWHAPKGFAFKVEGEFTISQQGMRPERGYAGMRHVMSKCSFIKEYEDQYKQFLDQKKGNEKAAFKLLKEDVDMWGSMELDYLPKYFIGKWIIVDFKKDTFPIQVLKIAAEAEVETNNDYLEEFMLKDQNTQTVTKILATTVNIIDWSQVYAEAVVGGSQITLIKRREKRLKLMVPESNKGSLINPIASMKVDDSKPCDTKYRILKT
jgi:hypothetical protein